MSETTDRKRRERNTVTRNFGLTAKATTILMAEEEITVIAVEILAVGVVGVDAMEGEAEEEVEISVTGFENWWESA